MIPIELCALDLKLRSHENPFLHVYVGHIHSSGSSQVVSSFSLIRQHDYKSYVLDIQDACTLSLAL